MPRFLKKKRAELPQILERVWNAIYTRVAGLDVVAWHTKEPVPFEQRESGKKLQLKPGRRWGELFDCAWFRFTGRVPKTARGSKVVAVIDINGEACVVDGKGNPTCGLTHRSSAWIPEFHGPSKRVVQLHQRARGGEKVLLWADGACNDLFGNPIGNGELREAHLAVCNPELRSLYYDLEVLQDLMEHLPEDTSRHQQVLQALHEASLVLVDYTEAEAPRAREALAGELGKRGGTPSCRVSAVGHAHIDLAWLWPIRETIRKGARTFATVLDLMDRYPDYVFGQSQPQLYAWMKEHYPSLYRKIKKRVAEGRWEVQGGMWVEADTNIPCGESLVRQLLYGKRFFQEEFDVEVQGLWLPDVFGYSGALPQILRKSGIEWFMTQKLSWSEVNDFPYHSFWWEGIDGTRVLAHMPPENTYNSPASPGSMLRAERNYRDKAVSEHLLLLFGIGDGGGGPGAEHLERLDRVKNMSGLPNVTQEPAQRFFERLQKEAQRFESWGGELYLERHRGTYTTQARNKRHNRKLEFELRELEHISTALTALGVAPYPAADLEKTWKELLLYQFHDILPGSSIPRVYDECLARYGELAKHTGELLQGAVKQLGSKVDTTGMKNPVLVGNSLSWEREEWLKVGRRWRRVSVPSMGYSIIDFAQGEEFEVKLTATASLLENELLAVRFTKEGAIRSIRDKEHGREVLRRSEPANHFAVYPDRGDAWDLPYDYPERAPQRLALEKVEPKVDGPRARLLQVYCYGESRLEQEIVLVAGSRRLEFHTKVSWKENAKMLRTSFPVDIHTDHASCEIQFGHLRRPTLPNTSWDEAMFEVCAQKWVDLSQGDYGVALLNDCKYGHKLHGNTLDLNLLRSPHWPDPAADRAQHEFSYALLPHAGDLHRGGVVREGYAFNVPLRVKTCKSSKGDLPPRHSFLEVDAANVVVETVKKAEEGEEIIVRLYEAEGRSTRARLRLGFPIRKAALADMMEREIRPLLLAEDSIALSFKPFEIHSVRCRVG